jgi:hypothetical protein
MHRDHELFWESFGTPAGRLNLKSPLLPQAEEMPAPAPAAAAAVRLGPPPPYLKTHGGKVARLHMLDWIVLVLLGAIDVGLNLIEPFHRFVGKDMLDSLLYPLKDNTVPVWAVPVRYARLPSMLLQIPHIPSFNARLIEPCSPSAAANGWMQILAVLVPMLIFAGIYIKRRNTYDLHHAILGRLSLHCVSLFRLLLLSLIGREECNQSYAKI